MEASLRCRTSFAQSAQDPTKIRPFVFLFSYNSLMLFMNSLGVTILLPLNSSKGKCLFPVIIKSALAFMAHSKTLLSGSSALSIFNSWVGVTTNAFRLILSINSVICFSPNLKRGLLRTASYSFKSAGETKNFTLSFKPKDRSKAGKLFSYERLKRRRWCQKLPWA